MRFLIIAAVVVLPTIAQAERLLKVTMNGQSYTARVVTDEPSGHLRPGLENKLKAGPFEDAVRIGGVAGDNVDTAIRVLAAACGFDYDRVKDWGAYGDPVWTDPRNGEIVFWTTCTPD